MNKEQIEQIKSITSKIINKKSDKIISTWKEEEEPTKTDITILDNVLNGGLTQGITLIGGLSGYGKSTLSLNAACNIAHDEKANKKVIYFSLEMSENELIYKALSNILYNEFNKKLTYKEVRECYKTNKNIADIEQAWSYYNEHIHNNLTIYGKDEIKPYIEDIVNIIEYTVKELKIKPIIVFDYLQYCRTNSNYITSDKQIYDKVSRGLLDVTNIHGLSAIVLSSLNRESYKQEKSIQAFKGSGDLEYSAVNCIILDKPSADIEDKKYKQDAERKVLLTCLKSRYGELKEEIIHYNAKYNSFEWRECKKDPTAAAETDTTEIKVATAKKR